MNRAHPPKVQYCSEVVGREQKSMYFPATNKLLMTVPRRGATHPEMEYHRLVAFPWWLRIGRWKYLLTSRIHFCSPTLWKVNSMKPQNYISLSSYRKTELFVLVGKLKNSRNMENQNKSDIYFYHLLAIENVKAIVKADHWNLKRDSNNGSATKCYVNVVTHWQVFANVAKRSRQDIAVTDE